MVNIKTLLGELSKICVLTMRRVNDEIVEPPSDVLY